jgi:hypothetical protein
MNRHDQGRVRRAAVLLLCGAAALAGVLLPASSGPSATAAAGDIGYEGASYAGVSNAPTSDKPQSKLWHNDGSWWAVMYHSASSTWHIYRLNRSTETWVDTGVQVDNRKQSLADVLWDGNKLYVGSHYASVTTETSVKPSVSGRPARLYRYSYNPTTKTYSLDSGFPAQINNFSSESLAIDKDSTGRLWATWTQVTSTSSGSTVKAYVNSTNGSDSAWGTPSVLPATGAASIAPDDISSVVAYGRNRVGVMWSNQLDNTMYWAWRGDGDAVSSWHSAVALRGTKEADDHLNLKTLMSDDQGRVYAVTKTSLDEKSGAPKSSPQIRLLVFRPGTGAWSSTTFGTISDCHTRPQLLLDEQNQRVYVFATGPTASGCPYAGAPGTIYMKSAPMSDPTFASGRGTPVIRDADSAGVNNVTATKQPVNATTGIVVLAANSITDRYWHADLALSGTPTSPVPTSSFTATPQSGSAPLTVQLTDTSTNNPTAWTWSFGDGRTSTAQNPSITYSTPGDYTVTLVARNAAGTGTTATRTISVSVPAGIGISRKSTSTAFSTTATTSLSIPAPAGVQPGDVLVSCLAMNGSSLAAPAEGFTRMAAPTGVSNPRVYGYYKIAGPDEPANYVWQFHASVVSAGGIARYAGSLGLDGESSTASGASAKTATVPGVTTSTSGAMLVGCMGINSGSTSISITGPAGLNRAWDLDGKRHWYGDGLLGAAGPTGSRTWTFSSGREWAGWLVALRPS